MFKAVKIIANNEKRKPLLIQGTEGLTAEPQEQAELIAKHFENTFRDEDLEEIRKIPPKEITPPFTADEVTKAIKSLKNNKSPGGDNIRAEQLKYGGDETPQEIAKILNEMARTGEHPKEIKEGILTPLQKPGKARGPLTNLRPIILLSMLRKILAICLIRRIGGKIDENIPIEQAAYRAGRGTTEHTFAYKILAEKAITSKDYELYITLMDMSKAFDTVRRHTLLEDLATILDKAELHLIKLLVEDVSLKVRVGSETSNPFTTKMGVPQGDCLSPILFTLYLAKALQDHSQTEDHPYAKAPTKESTPEDLPPEMRDHTYCTPPEYGTIIRPKYADDIGWAASNNKYKIEKEKNITLPKLKERGLKINEAKTEEYLVKKNGPEDWKKCKILGSLIDTNEDIKRRKQLTNNAMKKLEHIFDNNNLNIQMKIRVFRACAESIFLYNSELWTLTKTAEKKIDSYHRRILRKAINIKWPKKISSEDLYKTTKQENWSAKIKTRRLRWYGHAMRLPEETPAKMALQEVYRKVKKLRGGQTTTWISVLERDLSTLGLTVEGASKLALDRDEWRKVVWQSRAPCACALRA